LTDFQNSFIDRLGRQFATQRSLKFPPHVKGITTLHERILKISQCWAKIWTQV